MRPPYFCASWDLAGIVCFPWDVDRLYWDVLAADHSTLLRNAIDWAANEEPSVKVTGPGMLDVTLWRQRGSMTVHLVNLTNPMGMRPNFHELIPSQRQTVRVPGGTQPTHVQLVVAGRTVPIKKVNGHPYECAGNEMGAKRS